MLSSSIRSIKNALCTALEYLPDFNQMNPQQKGTAIDQTFKSLLKDLMNQFGMQPGIDYVDNLKDNEPATDFVALSQEADEIIRGLMEGKIIAISAYMKTNKQGNQYPVSAHFRRRAA